MTAKRELPVDPWLRTVDRYRKRGWTLPCDCPCHAYRSVREAVACCPNRGMRYIPAENTYQPWPDQDAS